MRHDGLPSSHPAEPAAAPAVPARSEDDCMVTDTKDVAYTSTTDLAARVRRREVSPVELVDACIQRIEARNPSLTAFVYLDFDAARRRARGAERAVLNGQQLGPPHGVPTTMRI